MGDLPEGEHLIVGVPSANGFGVIKSVFALIRAASLLGRRAVFFEGYAGNIPRARNAVLSKIRGVYGPGTYTMLWWDTDMLLLPGSEQSITGMVRCSEEHDAAVTCNYKMATGENVLMDRRENDCRHLTDDEVSALQPGDVVAMSGLGLCAMPMDTEYVFHADTHGEDIRLWYERPDLELRYYPVPVHHGKLVWL